MIEKPKNKNVKAEENLRRAEFNFMVVLKTLIHKNLIDLKLQQLKIPLNTNQTERALEEASLVFSELPERCRLLLAGDIIVISGDQ